MREKPTWRIPAGILGLLIMLILYGLIIASYVAPIIATWPGIIQLVTYALLGVVWLLPLRRFLIWMETGRWTPPES